MKANLYVDPDFSPTFQSISRIGINKFTNEKIETLKSCSWKRPSELPNANELSLFGDDPHYDDIKQGTLGNCYFLCACASLAEFPQMVRNVFQQEEISEDGSYILNVYYGGSLKPLKIDDLLPCNNKGDTVFAHTCNNKLWVVLLEKAWAKVNLCYENCTTGFFEESIQFLTGAPSIFINNSKISVEDLYTKIYEADDNNQIMGCFVPNHPNDPDFKSKTGLIEKHLYSLIGIYTMNTNKEEVKLLKIRNPWGYQEWTGDWSDKSPLWTESLKEELEFEKAEDGDFFIKIEDYIQNFSETYISAANAEYYQCSKIFDWKYHTFSCVSLYIYEGTEGYISVNQPPIRRLSAQIPNYKPGLIGFMLFKIDEESDTFEFIQGRCDDDNMVSLKLPSDLKEGNYIIVGKSYHPNSAHLETYFSVYTNRELTLEEYTSDDPKLLETLMIIAAKKTGKKTTAPNHPEIEVYDCFVSNKSNLGCYAFINLSTEIPINVQCSANLKGMIELNNKPLTDLQIFVNPNESGCFIFVRTESTCTYDAKYNCIFLPKSSPSSLPVNTNSQESNQHHYPQNQNFNSQNLINSQNTPQINNNFNINNQQNQFYNQYKMNPNINPINPNQQYMNMNSEIYNNNPWGNLYSDEKTNEVNQYSQNNSQDLSWNTEEMVKKIMSEGLIYRQFAKEPSTQLYIYTLSYNYFQYFVFLNDSEKKLRVKMGFKIMNGIILEEAEKDQSWSITLQQGERCCKRFKIISQNYNFEPIFNYQFN